MLRHAPDPGVDASLNIHDNTVSPVDLGTRRAGAAIPVGPRPFNVVAAPDGFLQVAIHTKRYAENLAHVRDVLLLAFPVMLLFTGGLGWLLARGSLGAIASITGAAQRITGSNLRESIPTTGSGDELDELAGTLNAMMQRIREGVDRMHRFNANAAHEIRTPLSTICGQIEVALQEARDPEEYRQVLEQWANADASLQPFVRQAQAGLARVGGVG